MRNRIERLRLWLILGAGLLVMILAVFIGSARYLRRHLLARLPAKLGANIKSQMTKFTYSHSNAQGRTVYTIHAAEEAEYENGKIILHGVSMVLYGSKGDRADHVSGDEFEYDQSTGVLRAIGPVYIDMQTAPTGQTRVQQPGDDDATCGQTAPEGRILHAKTSGLVYLEKLGVAATSEPISFQMGQMTGQATGADYNTDSGQLMLHSAVRMDGLAGGHPVLLTASSAELDNREQLSFLTGMKYVTQGRTVQAQQATLHTRGDGTLARIEAQGDVTAQAQGGTMVAAHADVTMGEHSQAQSAVITGGVSYAVDEPLRQGRGQADEAVFAFDERGQPARAVFTGSVHMTERTRATASAREPWSVRDLTAAKFEAALAASAAGKSELRDADASGRARLTIVDQGTLQKPSGATKTEVWADDLKAHLLAANGAGGPPRLDTIAGRGHTLLHEVAADGIEQTSAGDALDAKFRQTPPKTLSGKTVGGQASRGGGPGRAASRSLAGNQTGVQIGSRMGERAETPGRREVEDTLLSAVQAGHVTMTRLVPAQTLRAKAAKATRRATAPPIVRDEVQHATAERAVYDGDTDRVMLTGAVQLTDQGSVLWANQVALDRQTGDAQAAGAVKVSYVQDAPAHAESQGRAVSPAAGENGAPSQAGLQAPASAGMPQPVDKGEPVHILADRAELTHATEVATFHGNPVRMWQAGSQVQAPVIELDQVRKRLTARGDPVGDAAGRGLQVHTVLAGSSGKAMPVGKAGVGTTASASAKSAGAKPPQVYRIASGKLIYSDSPDAPRQAQFTGGVRVESTGETMLAHEATAFLTRSGTAQAAEPAATQSAEGDTGGGSRRSPGGGINVSSSHSSAVRANSDAAPVAATGSAGSADTATGAGVSLDGRVERVVATGHIEIDQPARRATGERLVYTASDQLFVLTGDRNAPAKVVDTQGGGTTVGTALQFHSDTNMVEALGAAPGEKGTGERVRTETPVKKR